MRTRYGDGIVTNYPFEQRPTYTTYQLPYLQELLADSTIAQRRGKLLATIGNARAAVRLWEQGMSRAGLLCSFEAPAGDPPLTVAALPASTPESEVFSRELRRRGFCFVGSTTVYAAMPSLGVVNDHLDASTAVASGWSAMTKGARSSDPAQP